MKKQFKVPFDKNGNQLTYGESWNLHEEKDNYEFDDVLYYDSYERGRSALNIVWKNNEGRRFRSGMAMLDDILLGKHLFYRESDNKLNDYPHIVPQLHN